MGTHDWDAWSEKAKAEGGSGQSAVLLPEGEEVQAVAGFTKAGKTSKKNIDKVDIRFSIVSGPYEGEVIWHTLNFPQSAAQYKHFKRAVNALGVELEGSSGPDVIATSILGAKQQVTLVTMVDDYDDTRSKVQWINRGIADGAGVDADMVLPDGTTAGEASVIDNEDDPF
jgi:hypothetical protein